MSPAAQQTHEAPRAWQRMLSGRRLDLLNPSPKDVEIEDIAHGLARVARWNGQTKGAHALSVAQHSIIVADIVAVLAPGAGPDGELAALLHDSPEYVIGDLISPFKAAIGLDYKAFEEKLLAAIHVRFSLPHPLSRELVISIKRADRIAAYYEATGLAGFDEDEGRRYFGPVEPLPEALSARLMKLEPLSAGDAQHAYINRCAVLRTC
jgi:5'-deoxynucleotidase YfbR-like HD superfamily hydrolase